MLRHNPLGDPDAFQGNADAGGYEGAQRSGSRAAAVIASAAGAAVVAALVASALGSANQPPPSLEIQAAPEATGVAEPVDTGLVRPLPPSPLAARSSPLHVWTGREFVLWGGTAAGDFDSGEQRQRLFDDGAAFNPDTGRWRTLAPSPLEPRVGAAFAWAGDRLIVWGGSDERFGSYGDGAVYFPEEDRWERLPPAPIPGRMSATGWWTGTEFVVFGGSPHIRLDGGGDVRAVFRRDGAAYDPATATWRVLASAPDLAAPDLDGAARLVSSTPVGDRLLVWSGTRGAVYDPGNDAWRPLDAGVDLEAGGWATVAAIGDDRVAIAGVRPAGGSPDTFGIVYRFSDNSVEAIPDDGLKPDVETELIHMDDTLLALPGLYGPVTLSVGRWDVAAGTWQTLPALLAGSRQGVGSGWTGDELLLWGGSDGISDYSDGVRWTPPPVDGS